jgi:hypothetical protein
MPLAFVNNLLKHQTAIMQPLVYSQVSANLNLFPTVYYNEAALYLSALVITWRYYRLKAGAISVYELASD